MNCSGQERFLVCPALYPILQLILSTFVVPVFLHLFSLFLETLISWPEDIALDDTKNLRELVENRLNREIGFPSTDFLLFSHKTFTFDIFPECKYDPLFI